MYTPPPYTKLITHDMHPRRCLALDPSDARAYVVLGKTLLLQKRYDEARALYQDGCSNTGERQGRAGGGRRRGPGYEAEEKQDDGVRRSCCGRSGGSAGSGGTGWGSDGAA